MPNLLFSAPAVEAQPQKTAAAPVQKEIIGELTVIVFNIDIWRLCYLHYRSAIKFALNSVESAKKFHRKKLHPNLKSMRNASEKKMCSHMKIQFYLKLFKFLQKNYRKSIDIDDNSWLTLKYVRTWLILSDFYENKIFSGIHFSSSLCVSTIRHIYNFFFFSLSSMQSHWKYFPPCFLL